MLLLNSNNNKGQLKVHVIIVFFFSYCPLADCRLELNPTSSSLLFLTLFMMLLPLPPTESLTGTLTSGKLMAGMMGGKEGSMDWTRVTMLSPAPAVAAVRTPPVEEYP